MVRERDGKEMEDTQMQGEGRGNQVKGTPRQKKKKKKKKKIKGKRSYCSIKKTISSLALYLRIIQVSLMVLAVIY